MAKSAIVILVALILTGCATHIYGWRYGSTGKASREALADSHTDCVQYVNSPFYRENAFDAPVAALTALFTSVDLRPTQYKTCMERAGWIQVSERTSIEFRRVPEFGAEYVPVTGESKP